MAMSLRRSIGSLRNHSMQLYCTCGGDMTIWLSVAVGMPVAQHPPHRSVRAEFPHTALILDEWRQIACRDRDAVHAVKTTSDQTVVRCAPIRYSASGCDGEACFATGVSADTERCSSPEDFPVQRGIDRNPARRSAAMSRFGSAARASGGAASA